MSTEFPPDIIQTATVAIFSPNMQTVIVIVNERLGMILPPGGRKEEADADIFATALREVEEEIGLNLLYTRGHFFDADGDIVVQPEIITQEDFEFIDTKQKARNSLYFFRLLEFIHEDSLQAELKGLHYTKYLISKHSIFIGDREYIILDPETKKIILRVMQD